MTREYCLPRRTASKLMRAAQYAVTVIAAPSGYGKTSSVRRLEREVPEGNFIWCPSVWEDAHNGWRGLCEQIARFDPTTASALLKADVFGAEAEQAAELLRGMNCPIARATYFIIDDFHLLQTMMPMPVIHALINHTCERLHIILVGQGFKSTLLQTYGAYSLNWIGPEDLLFVAEDIRACYQAGGIALSEVEAELLLTETHGWAAAVGEALRAAMAGDGNNCLSIGTLLGRLVLDRLPQQKKTDMLSLGFFDEVSEGDICSMWDMQQMDADALSLLASIPLLTEDEEKHSYVLFPALREFLKVRLLNAPAASRQQAHRRAGNAFAARGDLVNAIACYYPVKDYQGILSMDLKLLSYTIIGEVPFENIAREIVMERPMDVKREHPIAMLRLAYHLNAAGDFEMYEQALSQVATFVSRKTTPHLHGEWLLISMLRYMPDIDRMHNVLLEAEGLLSGRPKAIPKEEPFLFGCPSIWFAFYSTPGEGDQTADKLTQLLTSYQRVFGERGFGADHLYRGELASMRMRLGEAETHAYAAAALGEHAQQPTVVFGAALLLARIAIARRDLDGANKALNYLEESVQAFPALQGTAMTRFMLASVRELILSMMQEIGMAPEAAGHAARMPRGNSLLAQLSLHPRVLDLLMRGEVERAIGEMEAALSQDTSHCSQVLRFTLNTAIAMGMIFVGAPERAIPALKRALEATYQDGLMAMFVNHREALRRLFDHPDLAEYRAFTSAILAFDGTLPADESYRTLEQHTQLPMGLTDREREVAQLAARGLRNAEIAEALYISENTVKKHLRTIFEKLDIDRRSHLVERLSRG